MNFCSTPSRNVPYNESTDKPIGGQENNENVLGDVPQQLKQHVPRPVVSDGELLPNDRRLSSIAVIESSAEEQLCSESDQSRLAGSEEAFNRKLAEVAPNLDLPSAITKPPRRKAFEVAQTRIVEQKNQRPRDCQPGLDAIPARRPNCSDTEESPRLAKKRKRAIRPPGQSYISHRLNTASPEYVATLLPHHLRYFIFYIRVIFYKTLQTGPIRSQLIIVRLVFQF